jgi:DNA polymerase-3 subunit beta
VVERRNTIPILSNVLLEAGDDQLRLTATDMDLSVVESVAASVGQPGATTAPAHTLYDIVRKPICRRPSPWPRRSSRT